MAASLAPSPIFSAQDDTGAPLVGGLLFTYLTGSNTPSPTYTDASGLVANTNPIVLDDYGQAQVWLSASVTYRFQLALPGDGAAVTPPTDPIYTVDNISVTSGVTSIGGIGGAITLGNGLFVQGQMLSTILYRSYLAGLQLSTAGGSPTFGVTAGIAVDSTDASLMLLPVSLNKTTSAFGPGSGNGALDTNAIAASTWYHVFLIQKADQTTDILISLSATAPNLPVGYNFFRRIGAMRTDGSSDWRAFVQNGDDFLWVTPVADATTTAVGTAFTLTTLTVPTNVVVQAYGAVRGINTTNATNYLGVWGVAATGSLTGFGGPAVCMMAPSTGGVSTFGVGEFTARTNVNGQVNVAAAVANSNFDLTTYGWNDTRGRDA